MQKVWDGSNWVTQNALKVWNGSAWVTNAKLKARTSISWLPTPVSDGDVSQVVKWSVEAPTPPPPPPPVTHPVPDLDLKTTTELNDLLTPLNFGYTIAGYETTSILANDDKVVIDSQIPPAGESLAEFNNVSIKLYNFVQPTTIVPNVGGLLKSAADQAIVQANLVVGSPLDTVETYDATLVGKVVEGSQFPSAGTEQDQGTSVIYDYYVQKAFVTVPNLVDTLEEDIYTTLSALNLSVGTRTTEATANPALDGKIKSTFPVSGTQVQTNSSVNYTVYVNTLATVPNLVGLTQAQAETALQNANLYSGTITNFETTVVADEGKVRSQGTAASQTVAKFSGVNFVVNVPNTTTTVPNFGNLTTAQADALRIQSELNIQLGSSVYTNDTNLQYKIVPNSQSPTAGTVVAIYSTVTMSVYLPFPQFTVPSLIGQTPSSGAIDANFTWGSNSLAGTSTQTTSNFGKVASQLPAAGTQAQAQAINYGVYVDGRPTVPNVVGSTQSSAQTSIANVGLNYSVSNQALTSTAQNYLAGTVASQSPTSGTRLASGGTVSIVVYTAYVPQPVTKYATVYVGDDALNGYNKGAGNVSTADGSLDFTWQAQYKLLNGAGTRVQNITYTRMSNAFVGYASATNGKQAYTCRINPTTVDSYIKNNITNGASYTTGTVDFVFGVGTVGNNGKLWYLDWMGDTTSSPSTYTDGNRSNTQAVSNINNGDTMSVTLNSTMKNFCWTNGYGLGIAAGTTASNASVTYGSVSFAYYAAQISWTEYQ
jgi:beta-lactam-binding protein with PASTA domain